MTRDRLLLPPDSSPDDSLMDFAPLRSMMHGIPSPVALLMSILLLSVSGLTVYLLTHCILALRNAYILSSSCLYRGFVSHTRLKGAASGKTHSLQYPIFFSLLDLEEIHQIQWKFWPIYITNDFAHYTSFVFSCFEGNQHLKGFQMNQSILYNRVVEFLNSKCEKIQNHIGKIKLLSHLTYFGYCFNPLSIYYVYRKDKPEELLCIIAEVSNTPWIEQHSYALHETVPGVEITRSGDTFHAVWNKGAKNKIFAGNH